MRSLLITAAATVAFTSAYAPAATLSNPVADGTLAIDGNWSDWDGIERYPVDPDEGHPIDIGYITIAHDSTNVYVRYQMYFRDEPLPGLGGRWKLLLDTDQNAATGYQGGGTPFSNSLGAELMIEGASVFQYTGTAPDGWGWNWAGYFGHSETTDGGKDIELYFPRSALGASDTFNFILWVDSNQNGAIDGEGAGGDDLLPDGAAFASTPTYHTYTLVPEPGSLGLLGAAAVLAMRRRR